MISIRKLFKDGRNYLTPDELRAIADGKLRDYLNNFLAGDEEQAEINRLQGQGNPLLSDDDETESIMLGQENLGARKRLYNPQASASGLDLSVVEEQPPYAIVQLDF